MKYNDFFQIDESKLSKSELEIHNFMVANIKSVLDLNIVDIEKKTFLSRATIERYLKKAGTTGFKTYKIKVNEFLNFNKQPIVYEQITDLLVANHNKKIGITAQGTTFLAAQYLNRRLKFLKFDCEADSFMELHGVKPHFDIMIVLSMRGDQYSGVTDVLDYYDVPMIAITKPDSYIANIATLTIDNNSRDNMNLIDLDDISGTINIIETLIRDIARKLD
ncbi:hypothetical protein R2F61_05805 [Mollicutes bacterium LVI A0078]|nr:hypothetical protein RZE84_05810 [Mollicutes bacterium LVI A0075]WOO90245.1 hypothetical protein R2F61_05805 [Mollicutes bacterium LVI A0078]